MHCYGGVKNGSVCEDSNKCVGGTLSYKDSCSKEKNVRGLCVGGLNHDLFCGSSLDCPSKKYNDSLGETVEYGVCVGSSLDNGKSISKSLPVGSPVVPVGQWRLYELFVQSFHTWLWDEVGAKYGKTDTAEANDDLIDHSGPYAWDALGTNIAEWKVNSKSPVVYDIKINDSNGATPVTGSSSTFNAILRFNAYADNNQMPIVRMAVDWGDDSKPYVMQGWFKNRKEKCVVKKGNDYMVCQSSSPKFDDFNKPCEDNSNCDSGFECKQPFSDNYLHFGNSSSACEEGYYQFTHIYECVKNGAGWDAAAKSCKFTPKVQVLDNWGWCNSSDGNGRWNDEKEASGDDKKEGDKKCFTGSPNTNNPWTFFTGMIEVKP